MNHMAEEEVLAAELSPAAPSDHKRKLEDLEPEAPEPNKASVDHLADLNAEPVDDAPAEEAEVAAPSSEPDVKRARLDDKLDGPGTFRGTCSSQIRGCVVSIYMWRCVGGYIVFRRVFICR